MTIIYPAATQRTSAAAYSQTHHRWAYLPPATVTLQGEGGGTFSYPGELFSYDPISAPYILLQEMTPSRVGEFGRTVQGRLVAYVTGTGAVVVPIATDITTLYDDDGNPVAQGAGTQTLGFYGATPVTRPTVNWYSNDAPTLKALCAALVSLGLISGVEVAV